MPLETQCSLLLPYERVSDERSRNGLHNWWVMGRRQIYSEALLGAAIIEWNTSQRMGRVSIEV